MEKEFTINIWDFVDIDQVNEALDDAVNHKFVPTDIGYECLEVDKFGNVKLKAEFQKFGDDE